MKSKLGFLMSFILLMSVSCSPTSATHYVQATLPVSNTPALPVATLKTVPSPATVAKTGSPESCVNLNMIDFKSIEFTGYLLVSGSNSENHLLDPVTKQFLDVDQDENQIFTPLLLSPNNKYLLALPNEGDYFILRNANEVIRTNIPVLNDWVQPRWLDNEHMAFLSTKEPKQDVIVLSLLTGEWQSIRLDLPNAKIEQYAPSIKIAYYSMDPSLTRVFYNDRDGKLVLWDINAQKEIDSLSPPAYEAAFLWRHMWSPNGKRVVTPWPEGWGLNSLANELYVFDMDGKLKQWTNLNSKYAFANVEAPSWSPDGRHIGFWLKIGDSGSDSRKLRQWLAVLETNSLEMKVYCMADELRPWQAFPVVWSPDGNQLIVNFGSQLDGTLTPILVDLVRKTQAIIDTRNMLVEDWMAP